MELPETGVLIPFQTAPPELADPIVLHEPSSRREAPPRVVDVVVSESPESRITAVGGKAWQNGREP